MLSSFYISIPVLASCLKFRSSTHTYHRRSAKKKHHHVLPISRALCRLPLPLLLARRRPMPILRPPGPLHYTERHLGRICLPRPHSTTRLKTVLACVRLQQPTTELLGFGIRQQSFIQKLPTSTSMKPLTIGCCAWRGRQSLFVLAEATTRPKSNDRFMSSSAPPDPAGIPDCMDPSRI